MTMLRTLEYKLKTNRKRELLLQSLLDQSRNLYNQGLEELTNHYKSTGKHLNRFTHDKNHNKKEHPEMPAWLVDTTIARLHKSFANFFRGIKEGRKIGFPRFQSYRRYNSFEFRDWKSGGRLEGNWLIVGRHQRIKIFKSRELEGTPKRSRIIRRPSGWYVQVICEIPNIATKKSGDKGIGIDLGLKYFAADSEGNTVDAPKFFKRTQDKLAMEQKILSKKVKGSGRREKQIKAVSKIYEKITRQRKDFLHKLALHYAKNYDYVVIENLNIQGMVRNHHLAKSIFDVSWGTFVELLSEKLETLGGQIIKVKPHYTSQICSQCGAVVQKSLSQRTHYCPQCLYVEDRDVNAAINIFRAGQVLRGAEVIALC